MLLADVVTSLCGGRTAAVVVDPFAGSGTMLDAVAGLNTADGGRRRTVLVTSDEGGVCRPRVAAVAARTPLRARFASA